MPTDCPYIHRRRATGSPHLTAVDREVATFHGGFVVVTAGVGGHGNADLPARSTGPTNSTMSESSTVPQPRHTHPMPQVSIARVSSCSPAICRSQSAATRRDPPCSAPSLPDHPGRPQRFGALASRNEMPARRRSSQSLGRGRRDGGALGCAGARVVRAWPRSGDHGGSYTEQDQSRGSNRLFRTSGRRPVASRRRCQ